MVPNGWSLVEAKDICKSISVGVVIKPTQYYVPEHEGIKAFRSANVREGFINDSDWVYFSKEGHAANKKSHLKAGDVLIVRTGYPGTACVVTPEFEGSNAIDIVIARPNSQLVISEYLCAYTNSHIGKSQVLDLQGGMAQKHLNVGAYQVLKIKLPPLPEQKKIAQILSTWDQAIRTTEQLLANSQQQKKALMQQLLTGKKRLLDKNGVRFSGEWKKCTLGKLGDTFNGLTGKTKDDFGFGKKYIPYINIFKNSRIDVNALELVDVKEGESQSLSQYGDIFFTTSSETPDEVGMSSVLLDHFDELYLNSFCFGYRLFGFESLQPEYARYLLRSEHVRGEIAVLGQGATRYNLSKKQLMKLELTLPPIDEQKKIASVLSSADQEIETLQSQLNGLKQEKKALMQALLTGKRRVQL